ncbi:MAG: hypothetical protein KF855_01095 [Acidobacteria bacterium]|nr:hypothetical protein [Acidobacteriota bacterium]
MSDLSNEPVLPVMCHLTNAEFREREAVLLDRFKEAVIETRETSSGFLYELPFSDSSLSLLTEFMLLEKECCAFLHFSITANAGGDRVSFELTGPDGAKGLIKELFSQ